MRTTTPPYVKLAAVFLTATFLSGCGIMAVAGATAGAAISITGAVVSTGVKVTGKVIEKTIDVVTPSAPAEVKP